MDPQDQNEELEQEGAETPETDDRLGDVAAAWNELEAGGEEAEADAGEDEAGGETDAQNVAPARERDEGGRFAKPSKKPATKVGATNGAVAPAEAEGGAQAAAAQAQAAAAAPAVQPTKAPQSWRPTVREKWASLDPEVQQEVIRREREVAQVLQQTAEVRTFAEQARDFLDQFQQVVSPYEAQIRAEGSEPLKAIDNLFRTAMVLRTAPPPMRAATIAGIIRDFGVDVELVAQALDRGVGPQHFQQPQQMQPPRDPRVDQLFQRLEQAEQQRAQQTTRQAVETVEAFGEKHEFFEEVRETMADLVEVKAKQGVALSVDDAYTQACMLHPEVSKVLRQREAAAAAKARSASTQRARAAGQSVRPSTVATGKPVQRREDEDDRLADIRQAWDELAEG